MSCSKQDLSQMVHLMCVPGFRSALDTQLWPVCADMDSYWQAKQCYHTRLRTWRKMMARVSFGTRILVYYTGKIGCRNNFYSEMCSKFALGQVTHWNSSRNFLVKHNPTIFVYNFTNIFLQCIFLWILVYCIVCNINKLSVMNIISCM